MSLHIEPLSAPADWPELAALAEEYSLTLHRVNSPAGMVSVGCFCGAHRYFATGGDRAQAVELLREYLEAGDSVAVLAAHHRLAHARRRARETAARLRANRRHA